MNVPNYVTMMLEKNSIDSGYFNLQSLYLEAESIRMKIESVSSSDHLIDPDPIFSHVQIRGGTDQ
ncbi:MULTISPECIES: hypothetical protein [unclassified Paenibacillus]|uniref:hypothetical protein n=1 Tax=unclassified Paenibacillus TaxID=185978 RepID=UPI00362DCBC6